MTMTDAYLKVVGVAALLSVLLAAVPAESGSKSLMKVFSGLSREKRAGHDMHGGVPMGQPNSRCDDGKSHIQIDWDPRSTKEFTCDVKPEVPKIKQVYHQCDKEAKRPIHICYPTAIEYDEQLPTSGRHRPLWPKYGEYSYVPPQRWLHSLEHGAAVFLYHPCADKKQIEEFKKVAKSCLRRHIISAHKDMPRYMQFAVLTWKCRMVLSELDVPRVKEFVKAHALHSPESHTAKNGDYSEGLIQPADIVTDYFDTDVCPVISKYAGTLEKVRDRSRKLEKLWEATDQDMDYSYFRLLQHLF